MLPRFRHFIFLLAPLAAIQAARAGEAPADGTKYRPPIEPRFRAGQMFRYNASADYSSLIYAVDHSNTVKDDGSPLKADIVRANLRTHFEVEFAADSVLARSVFKNGSLSEAIFLVTRCQSMDEIHGLQTLIPPGSIVGARKQKDGQIAFAVNGAVPDPQLAAELSALIVLGNEQATNNDLLGAPDPVAVNAVWPINLDALLKTDLPACFPGLSSVVGSVSFLALRTDKPGAPRAVINADYSLVGVKPPFKAEMQAEPSTVNFNVVATAPVTGGPGEYDLLLKSMVRHAAHTGNAQIGMASSEAEFSISLQQAIHFYTDNPLAANLTLDRAPGEPDAPPLPPGLSAANILRTPVSWVRSTASTPGSPPATTAPTPAPAVSTPAAPAPQPAPPADTTPYKLNQDTSPFSHAQQLPPKP